VNSPFRPAEQVAPKVKCLIYGAPGVGKTHLALSAPGKVAVVDTEGGTAFYADRVGPRGLSEFHVLPTKTFAQVELALKYLAAHPAEYATLVIDPVTVLYETLQDAAQVRRSQKRNDPDADLEQLDWQQIKRAYKRLMTDLVNLPLHVVVVAREREDTERRGRESVHIGWKPDAEKSTGYYFDTIVRLVPGKAGGREAIVEKDRTGTHELAARLDGPTFAKLFSKALKAKGEAERTLQSDDAAARADAETTLSDESRFEEELRSVGPLERTGKIAKGDGRHSNLEARETPDGHHIGFRLAIAGDKAIPQVVLTGALGSGLTAWAPKGDTLNLVGVEITVEGELFEVHFPGRRMYHRLVASRIEVHGPDGFTLPAPSDDDDLDGALALVPEVPA
jgi:hypothetical protein